MSKNQSILIVGASSEIAQSIAYRFAREQYDLLLVSRKKSDILELQEDLLSKFDIQVTISELDIIEISHFSKFIDNLKILPDVVLCAVGLLGDQHRSQENALSASLVLKTNFEGPAIFLENIASKFSERGAGTIIGISSVAGERGRQSNYFYGSSKAGFTVFLSGLRNRLSRSNVHVITIIPGFVNTKMIKGISSPKFLTTEPRLLAEKIYKGLINKKDIVYSDYKWKFIMCFIRLIPEKIFKKLKL
ncbi:SDR family oxidoreductase [Gammaproteobacteria bacterium]|nr:SDR family oxidoreductase [Gammaproteobacteria bacterium]MDC1132227.1 SDR family oxidoreductase [Gammaproteobacteria bacterium]